MKTIIEMAREAGFNQKELAYLGDNFARFAELVTEQANARANASWTLMCEKMVANERGAIAKFFDGKVGQADLRDIAEAIRARSNT